MSYHREREQFIARMTTEGADLDLILGWLRAATTLQRYAELACSSEAADRDRVPCPATMPKRWKAFPPSCLCDAPNDGHQDIPRITLQADQIERRIERQLPEGWAADFQGDPRGCVFRVIPPSYAERNAGKDRHNIDAIGVPSGPTGLRF